jgi:hypothetical protein
MHPEADASAVLGMQDTGHRKKQKKGEVATRQARQSIRFGLVGGWSGEYNGRENPLQ